jgi:hypothetical protein
MSYDFNAYLVRASFPTLAELREHLVQAGGRVTIDDGVDFLTDTGWVNVMLDGAPTGFEVYSSEIDDNEGPDQHLDILESNDFDLNFNCKRDEREQTAARLVITAIATATNGWLCDPQIGTTVRLGTK